MNGHKLTGVVLAIALLIGVTACNENEKKLTTDKDKYSYAIGYQFAKNIKTQAVDVDGVALVMAVQDVLNDKESKITEEDMQKAMQAMYESRQAKVAEEAKTNLSKGGEFLEANKKKDGVKVTASGLQYKVIKEGEGQMPKESDTVVVHYRGTLTDGTEFDSSYKRNTPAEFPVNAVIPGWTEALQMMKKGAKYELVIPAELAYGERGRPSIPPNSVLLFEVELMDIKKN